jgi:hypothetical protein
VASHGCVTQTQTQTQMQMQMQMQMQTMRQMRRHEALHQSKKA